MAIRGTGTKTNMAAEFFVMRDFNLTVENKNLEVFMSTFGMECLIRKPTCFQSADQIALT